MAELASPERHALATGPFGSAISPKHFVEDGVPVLRGSNLSLDVGVRLRDQGLAFLPPDKAATFERSVARDGDLVFTCWGTIGQVGLIDTRSEYDEYVVSNKQMKLTPDPAKADSAFLYYLLSSPAMMREVQGQSIGVAVPGFNLGQLRALRVRVPPIEVQRRIGRTLGALDDLIDNNLRRIEVLEQMAQAIYQEWFVRFRYPYHEDVTLVDSLLGPIPDGWRVGRVDDHLLLQRGFDLPTKEREDGEIPVLAASGVHGWHSEAKAPGPGVVTGRSGTVGVVTYVPGDFWPLNTVLWVKEFRLATPLFSYCLLGSLDLRQFATGAAVPTLNRNHVHALPVTCPPAGLVSDWDARATPMFAATTSLRRQNCDLVAIRDLLLPKLVTGQIDASELDLDSAVESIA